MKYCALVIVFLASACVADNSLEQANIEADEIHSNGKTALMQAAKAGDNNTIRSLLDQGAEINHPNNNGGTAIMYAALSGNAETVALMLGYGADVNAAAKNGWTALMIAAAKGYSKIAKLLLESGAAPNQADVYLWTPLMRAVFEQRRDIVSILISHQAIDINRKGENGVTAIHLAAVHDDAAIAELLLDGGADPGLTDQFGRTPLDIAREKESTKVKRLLEIRQDTAS